MFPGRKCLAHDDIFSPCLAHHTDGQATSVGGVDPDNETKVYGIRAEPEFLDDARLAGRQIRPDMFTVFNRTQDVQRRR